VQGSQPDGHGGHVRVREGDCENLATRSVSQKPMRRFSLAVVALLALVASGCFGSSSATAPPKSRSSFTVTMVRYVNGAPTRSVGRFHCAPVAGIVPFARRACEAIKHIVSSGGQPAVQSHCVGIYGGPRVSVRGNLGSAPVRLSFGWTCGTLESVRTDIKALERDPMSG
jgi:hypothetical protein